MQRKNVRMFCVAAVLWVQHLLSPSLYSAEAGKPKSLYLPDTADFAGVTNALAANGEDRQVIIRRVDKLSSVRVFTGRFTLGEGGLLTGRATPVMKDLRPDDGMMLVRVILDLYTDEESLLLVEDEIALLDGGRPSTLVTLCLSDPNDLTMAVFAVGELGVIPGSIALSKGGNRIAVIAMAKDGNPGRLNLRIRGAEYGKVGHCVASTDVQTVRGSQSAP